MARGISLALIGEYTPGFVPHARTGAALDHLRAALGVRVGARWISTTELVADAAGTLASFDGIWVAPGSPYKAMDGALNAIRHGRETGVPVLGTCGGCQHMVIEYARNVLGFRDAAHAEYDPCASDLFVTPLSCSLVGQAMEVFITPGSRVAELYGQTRVREEYYCNFGINPAHQQALDDGGLRIVGRDGDGEARILTLPGHPFFLATLFVPQLTSAEDRPHPLLMAFVRAALAARVTTPSPA